MKRIMLASVVIILAFTLACGGGASATTSSTAPTPSSTALPGTTVAVEGGGNYWVITPAQLYGFKTKDFFLADTDDSYVGEIASTDLFINYTRVASELDKFPADKTSKIVLYCTSGIKSKTAAAALVTAGYTRVMELSGGIIAWQQQGYPTLFKTRTMT